MHGDQGLLSAVHTLCSIANNPLQPKAAPAPKPAPPPATPAQPASTPAQPAAPQHQPAPATSNAPATPTPAQPAAGAPATGASTFNDPSAMLIGNQNESTVREMEAMGFQRQEIDRALRAAFFNPDRAIEYLLNGIPEHIQAEQRQAQSGGAGAGAGGAGGAAAAQPAAAAGATTTPSAPAAPAAESSGDEPVNLFEAAAAAGNRGSGGARAGGGAAAGAGAGAAAAAGLGASAGAGAGAGGQMNMDFLRNSPYFQSLRQLVQQQPAMLEPILQQVAEGNPQLAQMIGQNQEQFLQLLAEVSRSTKSRYHC